MTRFEELMLSNASYCIKKACDLLSHGVTLDKGKVLWSIKKLSEGNYEALRQYNDQWYIHPHFGTIESLEKALNLIEKRDYEKEEHS